MNSTRCQMKHPSRIVLVSTKLSVIRDYVRYRELNPSQFIYANTPEKLRGLHKDSTIVIVNYGRGDKWPDLLYEVHIRFKDIRFEEDVIWKNLV